MQDISINNLWGDDFIVPSVKEQVQAVLKKSSAPKDLKVDPEKLLKSKKLSLEDRLSIITENVMKVLGQHKEDTLIIKDKATLVDYFDKAIENGIIAIDTETNNTVDTINCILMGPCLYTPGRKATYIPLNHIDNSTNERLSWQLTEQDCAEQFQRLVDAKTKILMHNGKFDYEVIHTTCGVDLPIYWDTMTAARMLDENEISAGLKQQYIDKINPDQEKYAIDHLFNNVMYAQVDPEVFALYAATDSLMTYQLYEWQVEAFKDPNLQGVYKVFRDIEMPLVEIVAKMHLRGMDIDLEYAERLSKKYHAKMDKCNEEVFSILSELKPKIDAWRLTPEANEKKKSIKPNKDGIYTEQKSNNEILEDPVNLDSPKQLAILIYDILKMPQVSTKAPRGTGVDELTALFRKTNHPLCEKILEKRTLDKLLNTFIDKLPNDRSIVDGKVHCNFLPLGSDTGRFTSNTPNLQQIPRANIEIKPMFRAIPGYSLVLADLSAAEVRTACNASGDPDMLAAYKAGKDLYSLIASKIYKVPYEDCLEHYPEGTKIMFEGEEVICGNEKIYIEDISENKFSTKHYRLVETPKGFIKASSLKIGDALISEEGTNLTISRIDANGDDLIIYV